MKKVINWLCSTSINPQYFNPTRQALHPIKTMASMTLALGLITASAMPTAWANDNNQATQELEFLQLDNELVLIYAAESETVFVGEAVNSGNYSQYQLSAWQVTSHDATSNEASTGTGAGESQDPPRVGPPGTNAVTDPIMPVINEAAQGSGIVLSSANWGSVEAVFGCDQVDFIMLKNTEQGSEEVLIGTGQTNEC